MYIVYSTNIKGSETGPNSDGDVRNLDGWSGQREREREGGGGVQEG